MPNIVNIFVRLKILYHLALKHGSNGHLTLKHVVLNYAVNLDSVKHAYGEDLIFSYTQSKYGELYYCPASKYVTQDQSFVVNIEQSFYEKSYHNLYIAKLFSA